MPVANLMLLTLKREQLLELLPSRSSAAENMRWLRPVLRQRDSDRPAPAVASEPRCRPVVWNRLEDHDDQAGAVLTHQYCAPDLRCWQTTPHSGAVSAIMHFPAACSDVLSKPHKPINAVSLKLAISCKKSLHCYSILLVPELNAALKKPKIYLEDLNSSATFGN